MRYHGDSTLSYPTLFVPSFKHQTMSALDLVLTNIIRERHITEIAGQSGTGKTRLLLYVISVVLLTTEHSIALIITSIEDVLSILVNFITAFAPLLTDVQVNATTLLKRLYFLRELSPTGLYGSLNPLGRSGICANSALP